LNISGKDFLPELGYGAPRSFVYFADRVEKKGQEKERKKERKKEREKEEMQLSFSEKQVALHLGHRPAGRPADRPTASTAATGTRS